MPARMIRDGLLESEPVLSLPVEARWLYVTILLSADDVGLFEAGAFRLARRADVRRELADRLLQMLVDVDLVRLYMADAKPYGFVPRFRQRLQIKRARCPLPPLALLAGDEDAINKIKHLGSNPAVDHGDAPCSTAGQPPEPEPEEEERSIGEALRASPRRRQAPTIPETPYQAIVDLWHRHLPELPGVRVMDDKRKKVLRAFWSWVLTTSKPSGERRAETPEQALQWIADYFDRARSSDWLMGRTARPEAHRNWRPSIEWVCGVSGLRHVMEQVSA